MKKKFLSIICSMVLVFVFIPFGALQITASAAVFKGSGTADDPYQISTAKDLFQLAELINDEETNPDYRYCYYKQTADIDLNNEPFTPIGIYWSNNGKQIIDRAFTGVYDGDFHSISNLYFDYDSKFKYDYAGLFGELGATADGYGNSEIKNLSVYGNLTGHTYFLGGIVGEMAWGSKVSNCSFSGILVGESSVGGIAGKCYQGGSIEKCYVNAEITGNNRNVGGIVGELATGKYDTSLNISIYNNYFSGNISCNDYAGGIAGWSYINGDYNNTINFSNNYYLITACDGGVNGENVSGCTKFSSAALKACADMLGSPFVDNNEESFNDGYPIFEWQSTPYQFKGSGTEEDPYQISSKEELETMRDLINSTYFNPIYGHAYYIQISDIDLENESWIPIGLGYDDNEDGLIGQGTYNYQTRMFFGDYNGNGKNIFNLNVSGNWKDAGLFGYIRGENSFIHELVVYGNISMSSSDWTGGIVGQMQYGAVLSQCAFIGNVSGGTHASGVAGYIWAGGSILNCYHNGEVSSDGISGGVVGRIRFGEYNLDGDTSVVQNCYHVNGTVTGQSYSGGITGDCIYYSGINNTIEITNCYFTAGTATNIQSENATVDTTYALPGSFMKRIAEDLGEAYTENSNADLNNGYPVFTWQIGPSISLMGDVNDDGVFNISDLVLFQQWLLAVPNVKLTNWEAADFCEDSRLDVFDLCLMKKTFIEQDN